VCEILRTDSPVRPVKPGAVALQPFCHLVTVIQVFINLVGETLINALDHPLYKEMMEKRHFRHFGQESSVFGAVWRLEKHHSSSLDDQECGYDRKTVDVDIGDETLSCRTYVMTVENMEKAPNLHFPSPHYKQVSLQHVMLF